MTHTRQDYLDLDAKDPLAAQRALFDVPEGLVYLDGNSLGAMPKATAARVAHVLTREWGRDLIKSWNTAGWMDLPRKIGDKIARLIGANAGEVIVADSTSINLFKVLAAALRLNPTRKVILSERDNFPTDLYMAQGLSELLGQGHTLEFAEADAIHNAITQETAVVMLTHVNYRTGRMHDMLSITAKAHAMGALVIWDLAHSAGAVPVDVNDAGADFAIGCGYKYLNGGPGAPAFVFVAERYLAEFVQPLTGWLGHAQPFAFDWKYAPAPGIERAICGTPPVLSLAALECGVDTLLSADMSAIRQKSLALTDAFIALVEANCPELNLITPREHDLRGSQAAFTHPEGYAIMQALISRGVIGDFRAPDILRFGFTPLYTRFADVYDAAEALRDVMHSRAWDKPEFRQKNKVT